MDSTPPSNKSEPRLRTKSASRLSRIRHFVEDSQAATTVAATATSTHLSLDIVPCSPKIESLSPTCNQSPKASYDIPLRDLLLLSPSPHRRSRTRFSDRLVVAEEHSPVDAGGARRRCRSRNAVAMGAMGCASPRNARRSRRRIEMEIREERDVIGLEEMVKPRRRRQSGKSKKEKLSLVPSIPCNKSDECEDGRCLEPIGLVLKDLVMWKDVAKSSLWFGFGSLCFFSSCFAKGITFSMFSLISQLGLLFLGLSFLSNSVCQRDITQSRSQKKLREEDILKMARVILPAANLSISKTSDLFSGEPSMTLKVAPFLLAGAEYGHLLTMWRIFALGFFMSFSGPKLYSLYYVQISRKVESFKLWVLEAWGSCAHKKIVALSGATAFWNLTSIRTRVFAAFIFLVILRYHRQHSIRVNEAAAVVEAVTETQPQLQQQQQQALVLAENGSGK